jgi:hypothetical protein
MLSSKKQRGTFMQEVSKKLKAPEPSQAPLWFVIIGMVIAISSRGMKDEMLAEVVFWFGVVFAVIAMLYYGFRPKHGMR